MEHYIIESKKLPWLGLVIWHSIPVCSSCSNL